MELWIRSQSKGKLVNVKELSLFDNNVIKNDFVLNYNPDYSNIRIIANDNYNLGTYKSKERALEVLDEIQKLLVPISEYKQEIDNLTINFKNSIDTAIYEMPEE